MSLVLPRSRATFMPGWVRNDLWRRARAVPSLDLRFADSKSLVDAVTGQNLITFTRASSGTFVDSAGVLKTATSDEPRFDHNPTTGESLGLLVEEQRTNLNTNSEALDTYDVAAGSVSTNQGVAPDGTFSADEITSTGGGAWKSVSGVTASTTYTVSVYAKYVSGGSEFSFGCDANPSEARVLFNLQAGTTSAIGANVVSRSMTLVGNGWYRCAVTFVATSTSLIFVLYNAISGSKWLCWGAQLEAGAFPTSYIPTTTSAATRSADVASISGSNFSSWYRQDEGSFLASGRSNDSTINVPFLMVADDGSLANEIFISRRIGSFLATSSIFSSGASQADMFSSAWATGLEGVIAVGLGTNNCALAFNGQTPVTDASVALPVVNTLRLGRRSNTFNVWNGTIRRLTYWPQRLPNSTLQALTV